MATYKNPWHRVNSTESGPAFYSTDAKPVEYRGYVLYHRIPGASGRGCWDVVKDGVCVGQYAGPSGARQFVDKLHGEGDAELVAFAQERVAEYLA